MEQQGSHAVILIGHGSLRSASGASMIRIAARLREIAPSTGVAPAMACQTTDIVEAAFLNYSRPTLAETVAKVVAMGVTTITIQPYFLIAGVYVQNDLRALIAEVNAQFPVLTFYLAPVLGEHPALTGLAQRRVQAALEATPQLDGPVEGPVPALLLMAHGTPLPAANAPLYTIARTLVRNLGLSQSYVGFLDCNTPTIPDAIGQLVAQGAQRIIALPYFLHLGRHVAEDLPQLVAEAQAKHPAVAIDLAHHLDYDLCLVDAVAGLLPAAQPLAQAVAQGQPVALPVL
jgi:sirohydrochlorin cobaltochelatase